jgi:FAD synthetase
VTTRVSDTLPHPQPDEFPEVRAFVEETRERYGLRCLERVPGPLREGLWALQQRHPHLRGCVTGRRSTDPHASCEGHFTEASSGWPPLVRVAPILRWSYGQVLSFAPFRFPFC